MMSEKMMLLNLTFVKNNPKVKDRIPWQQKQKKKKKRGKKLPATASK